MDMLAAMRERAAHMCWGTAVETWDPVAAGRVRLGTPDLAGRRSGAGHVGPQTSPGVGVHGVLTRRRLRPPDLAARSRPVADVMHLDFQVADLDAAVVDAESLGAEVAGTQPQAKVGVVCDPDCHPFCHCQAGD